MSETESHVRRAGGEPFIARDGATIFELLRPETSPVRNLSIAEGFLKPRQKALEHWHEVSEELYYVIVGVGKVKVGDSIEEIETGDVVHVPIGTIHALENTSQMEHMHILAISSPPYTDEDIFFVEDRT